MEPLSTEDPRHGTYAGYMAGCRRREACPQAHTCTDAERRYQNAYNRDRAYGRARKVPSIGSVRRIQALMRVGWSGTYLAERLGCRRSNLPVYTKFPTIRAGKAAQIAALYDELLAADAYGPSERTMARAQAAGFLPPSAWDAAYIDDPNGLPVIEDPETPLADYDELAIELAMEGQRVSLTRAERAEAVRRMYERGYTPTEIGERLRIGGSRINQMINVTTREVA